MSRAKDQIKQIVESLPEDSTYDDILRELTLKRMVEKGLLDIKNDNVISNENMVKKIKDWKSMWSKSIGTDSLLSHKHNKNIEQISD